MMNVNIYYEFEKKRKAKNIALMVKQISTDYSNLNGNNYINLFVNHNDFEGASAFNNSKFKKTEIKDVKLEQYVLLLNEISGKIQPVKVNALLDIREKPIYEMTTESGRAINTTAEYPYLVKSFVSGGDILNAKMEIINNLPLNLDDSTSLNNFDKSEKIVSIKGGVIFNTTIPKYSLEGNNFLLRKCLSNVNIIRDSDLAILDNCLSVEPKGTFLTSCPCFINNLVTSVGMFSSERNFNLFLEENMFFFSDEFGSVCHNRKDSRFCEGRKIILKNLIDTDTCSEQFQNLPNHDSCSLKSRSSTTDFTINNNVIININSHDINIDEDYLKLSDNIDYLQKVPIYLHAQIERKLLIQNLKSDVGRDDIKKVWLLDNQINSEQEQSEESLGIINNKKENKDANNVASKAMQLLTKVNNLNGNNYINLSVNHNNLEGASAFNNSQIIFEKINNSILEVSLK